MNQRGFSLLETMLSLFLTCTLIFFFTEIISFQQQGFEKLKHLVQEIYVTLGVHQEFQNLVEELRPFFCVMPGQIQTSEYSQTYKVSGIEILKLFQKDNKFHLQVYASSGDLVPMARKNHFHLVNCQESSYFLTNFKQSFILQSLSCLGNQLIFVEDVPKALSCPFLMMPIYYKEYVIDKNKLYLHAKGVPQVLFSGFNRLTIGMRNNSLILGMQLPHFGHLQWEEKFCMS